MAGPGHNALQAITRGGGGTGGGLYEVVRMIDRDDLDLIVSHGLRGEMRMESNNIWIQGRGEMTMEGRGAKDGKHRWILAHWKYILTFSGISYCQEHSPCRASRLEPGVTRRRCFIIKTIPRSRHWSALVSSYCRFKQWSRFSVQSFIFLVWWQR